MQTLYLIPSVLHPETELEVIPNHVKNVVGSLRHFLVEDARFARRYLRSIGFEHSFEETCIEILNKDSTYSSVSQHIKSFNNHSFGIISEAGCPGVADPGNLAVQVAHKKGIKVVPLVGPSSIMLALMGSGLNGQNFMFHGYLPIQNHEKTQRIKDLERISSKTAQAQIFIETPFRNNQLLADILSTANPESLLCIACNLTGPDEFISTKQIKDWQKTPPDLHKKPSVFILQSN